MSEFKTTEATNEAIEHVMNHLWARGEDELAILGIEKSAAAQYVIDRRSAAAPNFALWVDDEPVCIAGLAWSERGAPRGMDTWFLATHRFPLYYREITKRVKAGLEAEARRYDLHFMEVFSPCVDERAGRWFETLGFEIDVNYHHVTKGGVQLYRFVRKFGAPGVLQ